VEPFRKI